MSPTKTNSWAIPVAGIEQVLAARGARVIDLRSPSEFADDHVPGAANVPLLDNVERALIGTLYKQRSPETAFERGISIVVDRIGELVREIAQLSGREDVATDLEERVRSMTAEGIGAVNRALTTEPVERLGNEPTVVYCWRGGLRSASVVALLRSLGWDEVVGLEGGYKSYRKEVRAELDRWLSPPSFVLRGSTGVGKTLVLREIERIRPGWTLDLERAAGHRSSILGMVGLSPCTQKTFDSRIAARQREGLAGPVVFEGESRKVGDVIIPRSVWAAIEGGANIYLEAPLPYRIGTLIDDYLSSDGAREELRGRLPFIEERLGSGKWGGELVRLLDEGREPELVAILLEHYYDPLYRHSESGREYAARFNAEDAGRVARETVEWISTRVGDARPR